MKVIYHVDESEKWNLTLTNVSNMLTVYKQEGVDYQLEVLANSIAVKAYAEEELKDKMQMLANDGVEFAACANALRSNQIEADQLHSFVHVVPAGVVELAKRQSEGFAYIKP